MIFACCGKEMCLSRGGKGGGGVGIDGEYGIHSQKSQLIDGEYGIHSQKSQLIDPQMTRLINTMSLIIKVCAKTGLLKKV